MSAYLAYEQFEDACCFNCRARLTGPYRASGFAPKHGAWVGQCDSCKLLTWFDLRENRETEDARQN